MVESKRTFPLKKLKYDMYLTLDVMMYVDHKDA